MSDTLAPEGGGRTGQPEPNGPARDNRARVREIRAGGESPSTAQDDGDSAGWRSRIVDRGEADPADLVLNPKNWRGHPAAQRDALAGLLDQVGWVQDVVVNRRTGRLVDGHLRVELARARSETSVPVVYVDLSEEEEALVLASLDPLAAMATANHEKLVSLLGEAKANDAALQSLLSDLAARAGMGGNSKDGLTDPDDVPDAPDEAVTRPGDLWVLGDHRLLCGDSGSVEDLDRLLDGDVVHLVNTDPPYNVAVEPRSNNAIAAKKAKRTNHQQSDVNRDPSKTVATHQQLRPRDRVLANDWLPDSEFAALLRAWFGNVARVLAPGRSFYIWGGYAGTARTTRPRSPSAASTSARRSSG